MKVFAFSKIPDHPSKNINEGTRKGDIASFHRLDHKFSKMELQFFLPVVVDITIPCGDNYDKVRCYNCKYNNVESCDVQKYTQPLMSYAPNPRPLQKRMYNITREGFISGDSESLITRIDKTLTERNTIVANALKNEQPKTIMVKKEYNG